MALSLVASASTASGATINVPGTAAAGDFGVVFQLSASGSSTIPPQVNIAGWQTDLTTTFVSGTNGYRAMLSSKILVSGDVGATLTGMNGTVLNDKAILIFRESGGAFTDYFLADNHEEISGTAPAIQTLDPSFADPPVVSVAFAGASGALTMGGTLSTDGTLITFSSFLKALYELFDSSPSSETVSLGDTGAYNCLVSAAYALVTQTIVDGIGSATGAGTATGVGRASTAAVGSASGTGTATGVGRAAKAAVGAASGTGTATGVGRAAAASVGAAGGTGAALGVGRATTSAVGTASGTLTALAVSASETGIGSASGSLTAAAVGTSVALAVGAASGLATASAAGAATISSAGSATGTLTASATGRASTAGVGSASGLLNAQAVGESSGIVSAVGSASGSLVALGAGSATNPTCQFSPAFSDAFAICAPVPPPPGPVDEGFAIYGGGGDPRFIKFSQWRYERAQQLRDERARLRADREMLALLQRWADGEDIDIEAVLNGASVPAEPAQEPVAPPQRDLTLLVQQMMLAATEMAERERQRASREAEDLELLALVM
jgi:hypothetical protein